MAEHRPKRMKIIANRLRHVPWLVEEGFQFPHELEVQGTNNFIGLHGKLYPSLIHEFYNNFVYKNGRYITMVKGKLILLDEELFLAVGGLSSSGEPLGNCEKEQWNDFEALATYRSCLRDTVTLMPGGLTKVGSLTITCLWDIHLKYYRLYNKLAADIQRENDQTRGEIDKIAFILQTMSTSSNPPPTNKPS
ncbi:hypothetical protein Lal_00042377 [Lupinus albus]|nr:hypothetical protein Lal_00042377 [Lupinus albus]